MEEGRGYLASMAGPRRRMRVRVIAGSLVVTLGGLSSAALSGLVPGVPLRSGPLEDSGSTEILAPFNSADTGILWGVLETQNRSGSTIVLDSVEIAENPDQVELLTEPYLWDDSRTEILGMGGISAYTLPLPDKWKVLPEKREVEGFVVRSGTEVDPDDPESQYDGPSPEVMFEFAVPEKASTVRGITVRYHVGWLAYEKTYDMSLTMCPPNDADPCR